MMCTFTPASSIAFLGLISSTCSKPFSVSIATLRSFRLAITLIFRFIPERRKTVPAAGGPSPVRHSGFEHELLGAFVDDGAFFHRRDFHGRHAEVFRHL